MHGESPQKKVRKRPKTIYAVDFFCGAGGTSSGLIDAVNSLGYEIKLTAINHWDVAIATHMKNHEDVTHFCQSIETLNPTDIIKGGRLQLLIASPECTHHSRARGGKPRSDQKRADAWLLMRWIEKLYVENILIENVKEFIEWGPLTAQGMPDKRHKGMYFRQFVEALKVTYNVEYRILNCANYGDPTTRERFFLMARRPKHKRIVWPERTHASRRELAKMVAQPDLFPDNRKLMPWVPAREIIDWSLEGKSIFGRRKPLSPNTMRRIFKGLEKQGLKNFLVNNKGNHRQDQSVDDPTFTQVANGNHQAICEPFIVPFFGERIGQEPRTRDINDPTPTVTTHGRKPELEAKGVDEPLRTVLTRDHQQAIIEAFLVKFHGGNHGDTRHYSADEPIKTLDTSNRFGLVEAEPYIVPACHSDTNAAYSVDEPLKTVLGTPKFGVVEPYIVKFYGNGGENSVDEPLATVTAKDRFALCIPSIGIALDIHFRMLQPHELAAAMSFPQDYEFTGNQGAKVKQIGNAVPILTARALCRSLLMPNVEAVVV